MTFFPHHRLKLDIYCNAISCMWLYEDNNNMTNNYIKIAWCHNRYNINYVNVFYQRYWWYIDGCAALGHLGPRRWELSAGRSIAPKWGARRAWARSLLQAGLPERQAGQPGWFPWLVISYWQLLVIPIFRVPYKQQETFV